MIAAALMMLALSSAPAPSDRADVCESLGALTVAANDARRRGVTREQAEAAANEMDTTDGRQAAQTVIWYVYVANGDGRMSSAFMGAQVRRACLAKGEQP